MIKKYKIPNSILALVLSKCISKPCSRSLNLSHNLRWLIILPVQSKTLLIFSLLDMLHEFNEQQSPYKF